MFEGFLEEIIEARRKLGLPEDARVVVGYEAGHEGFWLVRALREAGIAAEVIAPVSLQVDRRAKRAKTDRLDAEALTMALWRYVNGEARAFARRNLAFPRKFGGQRSDPDAGLPLGGVPVSAPETRLPRARSRALPSTSPHERTHRLAAYTPGFLA